jgi:hypothetical protein
VPGTRAESTQSTITFPIAYSCQNEAGKPTAAPRPFLERWGILVLTECALEPVLPRVFRQVLRMHYGPAARLDTRNQVDIAELLLRCWVVRYRLEPRLSQPFRNIGC